MMRVLGRPADAKRPRSVPGNAPPRLSISVQYAVAKETLPARHTLRRWVSAAQECDMTVVVRFVGAREAGALNVQFRGKPYPTNVLTFVYDDAVPLAGDIVLCVPVIRREAR